MEHVLVAGAGLLALGGTAALVLLRRLSGVEDDPIWLALEEQEPPPSRGRRRFTRD